MAMNASAQSLVGLLSNAGTRFVVPVFQRPYTWEREQCEQLWEDILTAGRHHEAHHFMGAVVWAQDGVMPASGVTPLLLVDGQQRIATVMLLLVALAEYAKDHSGGQLGFSREELLNAGCLLNPQKQGDDHYKLLLSQEDRETFKSLLHRLEKPYMPLVEGSKRLLDNLDFFRDRLSGLEDPDAVWEGLQRLEVVAISLDAGQDNPQQIFESMNSTGKALSSSDLARNFVLMCLSPREQEEYYHHYWRSIEKKLGIDCDDDVFDSFLHGYLSVLYAPKRIAKSDVYPMFKRHVIRNGYDRPGRMKGLLEELKTFAGYHAAIAKRKVEDGQIKSALTDFAQLQVTTALPFLLSLCRDYARKAFGHDDFVDMIRLLESYFFRRMVCGLHLAGVGTFLVSLIAQLGRVRDSSGDYRKAFETFLANEEGTNLRFPGNDESAQKLVECKITKKTKFVNYLLTQLENVQRPKDPVTFKDGQYTIEHIMPRNALSNWKWAGVLEGVDKKEFYRLVNNIGNLTLTAYNSELSDRSFAEKRALLVGGYDNAHLALSRPLSETQVWNRSEIEKRAAWMVSLAEKRWPCLSVSATLDSGHSESTVVEPRASLRTLLEEGLFANGDNLFPDNKKCNIVATIVEPGILVLPNGEKFTKPSDAAYRATKLAGCELSDNGWTFWHHGVDGPTIQEVLKNHRTEFRKTIWSGFARYASRHPDFAGTFHIQSSTLAQKTDALEIFKASEMGDGLYVVLRAISKEIEIGLSCGTVQEYGKLFENSAKINAVLSPMGATVKWSKLGKQGTSKKRYNLRILRQVDWKLPDFDAVYEWMAAVMLALRNIARDFL